MIRINKYLAQCGVASRRNADILVTEGRVTVNGEVISKPGFMIDEERDEVRVDGQICSPVREQCYLVLNKPAGYITTLLDPFSRNTVMKLLSEVPERVYPVGRLDLDTEGVLLFTNDGELAHRLTHPSYSIKRVYYTRVRGKVSDDELSRFKRGIELPDGNVGRAEARLKAIGTGYSDLMLTLVEGRKREVKHLCQAIGHPVIKLVRIEFAGITCDGLKPGQWRYLRETEVENLRNQVKMEK